jgi:3-hydroxyacyl-[acyl-carrier-protein] dehydratase
MDYDALLKGHRKKPVANPDSLPTPLSYGQEQIRRIIPHRRPFLLVDRLTGLDLAEGIIAGTRYVDPDDPVFRGHFPGNPVYPGSLQIEMVGQLGLCMHYFLTNATTEIAANAEPVRAMATRVLGAYYVMPVLPGCTVTMVAGKLEADEFAASMIGQTIVDGVVCSVLAGQVVFLD